MGTKTSTIRQRFVSGRWPSITGSYSESVQNAVSNNFRVGDDRPNYKSVIERGGDATNIMAAEKWVKEFEPSKVQIIQDSNPDDYVFTEFHSPFPETVFAYDYNLVAAAQDEAAMRIRKKIQDEASDFSGPTFLGELADTARMIKHPGQALADKLNAFVASNGKKRGKGGRKSSSTKSLADSWLEASFGWQPLINDIASIAEASLSGYNATGIKRVVGIGKRASASSSKIIGSGDGAWLHSYRELSMDAEVMYIAGIRRTVHRSNTGLERVVERSRTNWRELAPAAWELMPWSFLIDYFSNIGDVISAASMSMSNVAWVSKTTRRHIDCRLIPIDYEDRSSSRHLGLKTFGKTRTKFTSVDRTTGSIPIPDIRFELPGRKGQLLNIAALLGSKFL